MTILICWHFLAFVLRAKFNTDEFWHALKPARVPDQLSGEAHPPARVWSDGSQMEELQGAAEWSGEWLSGERSCLCSLIPFPVHGPAQQRDIWDFAWIATLQTPVGTHGAQLHCVGAPWCLQVQLGWHLYTC